ncbi:MAG: hypothetical protein OSP8Acid_01570 [uncultured Acidilobus sp. OSP8]|nr:MAG: hypothetical protein OSP8Acid_01570 [uncultured Acidilobus sp. OSP8]
MIDLLDISPRETAYERL